MKARWFKQGIALLAAMLIVLVSVAPAFSAATARVLWNFARDRRRRCALNCSAPGLRFTTSSTG